MEENGRIEKHIVSIIYKELRATKKVIFEKIRRVLTHVTEQEVNQRVEWLTKVGALQINRGPLTKKDKELYYLSEAKKTEYEQFQAIEAGNA